MHSGSSNAQAVSPHSPGISHVRFLQVFLTAQSVNFPFYSLTAPHVYVYHSLDQPLLWFSLYSLTYTLNSESENMTTHHVCHWSGQSAKTQTLVEVRGTDVWGHHKDYSWQFQSNVVQIDGEREHRYITSAVDLPFALAVPPGQDNASYKISSSYEWREWSRMKQVLGLVCPPTNDFSVLMPVSNIFLLWCYDQYDGIRKVRSKTFQGSSNRTANFIYGHFPVICTPPPSPPTASR